METEQLISEVEKRPVLWDTSDIDYKDRNKKNEAWLQVTSALYENFSNNTQTEKKVIVQEVISKWRSVRDNYTRSLKKQAECNKSGSGVKKIQRYIFEQQLSFLKKCREQRPTCSSIANEDTPISDFNDIESNINNNTQCSENEGNQNDTSISPCHKSTPAKKRKTTHSLEDKLGAFLDSRTINTNSSSVDMTDEDMAFYTSTLPIVKTLTLNQKMRFRIEVMQLLQNIKHTGSTMESSIAQTSYVAPYRHHNMPISPYTYNDQYLQSNILRPNSASSSNSIQTYYTQFSPEDQNPPSNQSTSDGF
uniref:MADF domain-containing protein n=1 Tax=Schizaphis graminum TaxID=13262 RepID=A0A2S2P7V0_SCHGA